MSCRFKFPGAPEMDAVQTIRADGKITILNAGEIKVSGLTPDGAEKAILKAAEKYSSVKQVSVTVQTPHLSCTSPAPFSGRAS